MKNKSGKTLVVDLDGTLLRSDMLHESFWSALGRSWGTPLTALFALAKGKAHLKRHLQALSDIDVSLLPYNEDVIAYVKAFRENGGRTALVTATNDVFAERIADHLALFDEVHGSSETKNLKGPAKAAFLSEHFGENAFIYMGDAAADLPIWGQASDIVTVGAAASLRRKAEALGKPCEHLGARTRPGVSHLLALRPHQWLKNILVFLPMLAGHQMNAAALTKSLMAFVAFSLIASGVYLVNDLLDLGADRAHPRKRRRPFASGAVPISHGQVMILLLLGLGTLVAASLGLAFLLTLLFYFVLTTAYSLYFKREIVIDICILAGLYTIRIIAGGVATGISLSVWLLAFSLFLFLALAAVKRQAELIDLSKRGALETKGRGYHVDDLPIISILGISAGYVSVLVMALYVNSPAVVTLYAHPSALWGICCILLYWITRIVLLTHRGVMHDDPVVFAVKDRISQVCFLAVVGFTLLGSVR